MCHAVAAGFINVFRKLAADYKLRKLRMSTAKHSKEKLVINISMRYS
jgi:hypothetical protein